MREALPAFRGTYLQMPPPFSAKKVGGTPAYKLARLQKDVELKPVEVTVTRSSWSSYADGLATLRVVCSSGFYVRSLAHELGQRLGCGAHLEALRRTRAGEFRQRRRRAAGRSIRTRAPRRWRGCVPIERAAVAAAARGRQRARRAAGGHGNALAAEDLWDARPDGAAGRGVRPVRLLDARRGAPGDRRTEPPAALLHPVVVLV